MGNTRSQPCRRGKPQYLLYLIHRTWSIVADRRRDRARSYATDRETDLSSRCSECNAFDHGQSSLTFDSESDMAPNAEEELLVLKPWGPRPEKERLRPPTYNAEDYAIALRRWGRRPVGSVQESQGTLPSTTSSSSGYASGTGEMTLRQFTSVSELLNKLRADLRLAFPSFVQEFASPPADGIALLLETLRGVQLAQSSPPSSAGHAGPPRVGTRRAALDELGCVECLAACTERCSDAPRLLVQAQPGLLALTVCLTSSLNRSRVLALQLLTKVCQTPGGHAAVSEAVSTLRLRYGEGGRFRFLAGALSAPRAAIALRVAGLSFLNAFLKSAPRTQTRLYIQAEACEAGLEPQVLREWLKELDGREEDALNDLLRKEVQKWARNCVDVDALQRRVVRAEETCRILGKKISTLQAQLQLQQLDKLNDYSLDDREKMAVLGTNQSPKTSSNAEDEGISSSERSSSPENAKRQQRASRRQRAQTASSPDNDQETTIDDVIEELRIIVQDAEEEIGGEKREKRETEREKPFEKEADDDGKGPNSNAASNVSRSVTRGERVTYFGNDYGADSGGGDRTVKIVVKGPDAEDAIVPTILHPQPPRRSPPCLSAVMALRQHSDFTEHEEMYNSHDDYVEEDTLGDGSDSLLSASRLKYRGKSEAASPEEEIRKREFGQRAGKSCDDLRHFDEASDAKGKGPIGKLRAEQTGFYQSRSSKCKSEVEKKKQLRRSTSHDYLESNASSPRYGRSNGGRVENRIRKFESLNSFDDRQSLRTYERQGSSEYGSGNNGMRRSESFHHVSTQGGSDSGLLFYVTDFDLEPLVTRRSRSIDAPKSPTLLTKSLDRIDEGLDSIVDIVITEEKGDWNGKNKCLSKMKKSRDDDKTSRGRRVESRRKHLRSDELRSDELYEEKHRREWMSVEAGFRDRAPAILANGGTRHDSFRHNEGMGSGRLSKSMDSGIFAGRTYDTFGLGKSRFNAGKYSGGRRAKESPIGRRNTTSSAAGSRGKVTDVVSGLY